MNTTAPAGPAWPQPRVFVESGLMASELKPTPVSSGVAVIASADAVLATVPFAPDLMTEQEHGRAAGLRHETDRRSYVAAHVLLRLCCAYLFGVPVRSAVEQRCEECGGAHGRPRLPRLPHAGLSLSHSGGVVAAVAADSPVGIDVEPWAGAASVAEIARDVTTPSERRAVARQPAADAALLTLWVRKEAMVKLGVARLDSMRDIDLSALPYEPLAAGHRRTTHDGLNVLDLTLAEPAALGAVVSRTLITVASLETLAARHLRATG
jgi:4'-phosphopantetheinyl transferase